MKLLFIRTRISISVLIILFFFIVVGIISGSAATNTISTRDLSQTNHPVLANQLKPAICTMDLTNIVIGGNGNGTQANDLILGSAGDDKLRGQGGNDCIVGGAGNDTLSGGNGNDIIIGGTGDDDLDGGQNDDYLHGGDGTDTCNIKHGSNTTNDCENIIN